MSDRRSVKSTNRRTSRFNRLGLLAMGILILPIIGLMTPASATTVADLDETQFQLLVTPAATKLPADRELYYALIQLQVVDNENPIEAPENMELTISSSDPSVISLPLGKVMLIQGQSMVKVELLTTDKAGVAAITAQAVGVKSSTASITTYRMDSLEPTRLAIYAAPPVFMPDPQFVGMLYIQVLNSQNLPVASKNDITLDISSSDSTIGRVPSYALIPAGSSGTVIDFIPQRQLGQTTIKASAAGLSPGELSVQVDGPVASKLIVEFGPDIVPAVNYNDAVMTIQLVDENNEPVKASKLTKVLLKSSDSSIVEVPQYVEISAGKSYASTFAVAKGKNGTATITASTTGYATGINSLEAVAVSKIGANDPKQLKLFSVPSTLPPDNSEHQALIVAFQDMEGKPYRQISYFFQRIALSTSNTLVGEIPNTGVTAKETYAIAKFKTRYAIGETQITASLEGYQPAQIALNVGGSGPATVVVTQIPGIVEAGGFESESIVVSLIDHNGKPVASQKETIVFLSSSDPEITKVQASTVIPSVASYAKASVQPTLRAGVTTLTGSADGLGAGSVTFRTVGFTGSISEYHLGLYVLAKLPADGKQYDAIVVQLQDRTGLPVLAKADVTVSLSSGSLIAGKIQESVTIPEGASSATAFFKTSLREDEPFKITASSEGFKSVEAEMETTSQPLTVLRTLDFPTRIQFGTETKLAVDVYSGAIPVRNATVTFTGQNAEDNFGVTDAAGHAEGEYQPTLPGVNSIVVKVNKPGYEEFESSTRITVEQTVDVTITAETEAGAMAPVQLKVSAPKGVKSQTTKVGSALVYDNVNWGSYTITAPPQVKTTSGVYDFARWSDGTTANPKTFSVVEDSKLTAIYKAKYLVLVNDVNGLAIGGGYYDEGSMATIRVSNTAITGILTDKEFVGWSGSIISSSPSTDIIIDSSKTINAEWKDNYLKVALIGAAAAGGAFFYYWKIFKPKKELEEKARAPDLDWYKS